MIAYRTYVRSAGADHDMSAVAAFPNTIAVLGEYKAALDVRDQLAISCFMLFLDRRYHLKEICDVIKTFFSRGLGEIGIHLLPLILLAVCCDLKVVLGFMNALKDLVPDLRVLFLIMSWFRSGFYPSVHKYLPYPYLHKNTNVKNLLLSNIVAQQAICK